MPLNAFQQGQKAYHDEQASIAATERQNLLNEREVARQRGVDALAREFGDKAYAPTVNTQLRSTERADKQFIAKEEQRGLDNERTARMDEITEEERAQKNMLSGLNQVIGGIKAGVAAGAPLEDVINRFSPVLNKVFGVTSEELAALPSAIKENPGLLDDISGALRQQTSATRKAVGRPITIKKPSGKLETRQMYTDGTFDVMGGVDVDALTRISRAGSTALNANTALEKINPYTVGAISSAKELGKLTAKEVQEHYGTMMDTARGISQARYAIGLLDKGIKTGSFAEFRQGASRFLGQFLGVDDEDIQPTDEFVAIQGAALADLLATGAFGAGTGVSDNDVRFAKNIVAGNVELNEEALRKIIGIQISKSKARIAQYNKSRDAVIKRNPDFKEDFPRIKIPDVQEDASKGDDLEFETETKRRVFNPKTGRLE